VLFTCQKKIYYTLHSSSAIKESLSKEADPALYPSYLTLWLQIIIVVFLFCLQFVFSKILKENQF